MFRRGDTRRVGYSARQKASHRTNGLPKLVAPTSTEKLTGPATVVPSKGAKVRRRPSPVRANGSQPSTSTSRPLTRMILKAHPDPSPARTVIQRPTRSFGLLSFWSTVITLAVPVPPVAVPSFRLVVAVTWPSTGAGLVR